MYFHFENHLQNYVQSHCFLKSIWMVENWIYGLVLRKILSEIYQSLVRLRRNWKQNKKKQIQKCFAIISVVWRRLASSSVSSFLPQNVKKIISGHSSSHICPAHCSNWAGGGHHKSLFQTSQMEWIFESCGYFRTKLPAVKCKKDIIRTLLIAHFPGTLLKSGI